MVNSELNGVSEIRMDSVSKQFRGGALALLNVTMQVQKGEFVTLLGPSGCYFAAARIGLDAGDFRNCFSEWHDPSERS